MSTLSFPWLEGWAPLLRKGFANRAIVAQLLRGVDQKHFAMYGTHIDWAGHYPDMFDAYTLANPLNFSLGMEPSGWAAAWAAKEWGPPDEAMIERVHWTKYVPIIYCYAWIYLRQTSQACRIDPNESWKGWRWVNDDHTFYVERMGMIALGDNGFSSYRGPNASTCMNTAKWHRFVTTMRTTIDDLHLQLSKDTGWVTLTAASFSSKNYAHEDLVDDISETMMVPAAIIRQGGIDYYDLVWRDAGFSFPSWYTILDALNRDLGHNYRPDAVWAGMTEKENPFVGGLSYGIVIGKNIPLSFAPAVHETEHTTFQCSLHKSKQRESADWIDNRFSIKKDASGEHCFITDNFLLSYTNEARQSWTLSHTGEWVTGSHRHLTISVTCFYDFILGDTVPASYPVRFRVLGGGIDLDAVLDIEGGKAQSRQEVTESFDVVYSGVEITLNASTDFDVSEAVLRTFTFEMLGGEYNGKDFTPHPPLAAQDPHVTSWIQNCKVHPNNLSVNAGVSIWISGET